MSIDQQLDLFAMIDNDDRDARIATGIRSLFGLQFHCASDYEAAFERWCDDYGRMDSLRQSHAWIPDRFIPHTATDTCQATILDAELSCEHFRADTPCHCVVDRVYRGRCRHCGWHSEIVDNEDDAVCAALTHAHPGWHDYPVVEPAPFDDGSTQGRKRAEKWAARVRDLYGPCAPGFPVITERTSPGTRSVPQRSPWVGYDIAECTALHAAQLT